VYEFDTAAEPQDVLLVSLAQSSILHRQGIALDSSIQRQVHGVMAAKSSVSQGENSEIQKILLVMTKKPFVGYLQCAPAISFYLCLSLSLCLSCSFFVSVFCTHALFPTHMRTLSLSFSFSLSLILSLLFLIMFRLVSFSLSLPPPFSLTFFFIKQVPIEYFESYNHDNIFHM